MTLPCVCLTGVGAWSAEFEGVAAMITAADRPGQPQAEAKPPAAALLTSHLRRRASVVTRICAQVLEQCGTQGAPRLVMVSARGEIGITVELLEAICRGQPLSPTAFHNSVHNAALGYLSIGTDNRSASVAIAAGDRGIAMGALEAMTTLADEGGACVFIAAEEHVPPPFAERDATPAVGLGWRLETLGANNASPPATASNVSPRSRLSLAQGKSRGLDEVDGTGHHSTLPAWLVRSPMGPMAAVIAAHAERRHACVSLADGWQVTVEPVP